MHALIGSTIGGRYHVEAVLGEGGMAVVYRVTQPSLGTVFALKVLTMNRSDIRERFVQEGRVQAAIRHPNVVTVFDLVEVEGAPALVMEYVDGKSLVDLLQAGPLTLEDAESVFRGIVAGVSAAHAQGVVHRDLKPGNVLITMATGKPFPKVADFGLAKLAEGDGQNTRTGTTMGTPSYMAPEQIRDAKHVDARADVFALGCILYELVTGRQAFPGEDMLTVMTAVASGNYPPPESVVPELPERFRAAIRGALETDPNRRLPSCAALLGVLGGEPLPAQAEATAPRPTATAAPTYAPDKPEPARRATTAGPMAVAAGGLAAFAGLGLAVLLAVVALGYALTRDGAPGTSAPVEIFFPPGPDGASGACAAADGARLGFVNHRGVLFKRKGGTWVLPSDKAVYAHAPGDDSPDPGPADVVCTLPAGAKLRLVENPRLVGGKGAWVAVEGGAFDVPEPPPASP